MPSQSTVHGALGTTQGQGQLGNRRHARERRRGRQASKPSLVQEASPSPGHCSKPPGDCAHLPPPLPAPVAGRGASKPFLVQPAWSRPRVRTRTDSHPPLEGLSRHKQRQLPEQRCSAVPQPRDLSDRPAAAVPFTDMKGFPFLGPRAPSRGHTESVFQRSEGGEVGLPLPGSPITSLHSSGQIAGAVWGELTQGELLSPVSAVAWTIGADYPLNTVRKGNFRSQPHSP